MLQKSSQSEYERTRNHYQNFVVLKLSWVIELNQSKRIDPHWNKSNRDKLSQIKPSQVNWANH